jgi:hypothetical protein
MAKRLTKGKHRYLLDLCRHATYLERWTADRDRRAKQQAFEIRQNRAYMAIYC